MLNRLLEYIDHQKKQLFFIIAAASLSLLVALSILKIGIVGPLAIIAAVIAGAFVVASIIEPRFPFVCYVLYCFVLGFVVKTFLNVPVGLAMDAVLLLTWASILINFNRFNWAKLKNEHVLFSAIWFVMSLLEVLNPSGFNITGWFNELRFTAFSWLCIAPVVFLLFRSSQALNQFFKMIFGLSLVATLYGAKQIYLGLTAGEQQWLNAGNDYTHILNGKLRAFSMYSDAGQFGASQAILAVIALVLAMGPFTFTKRILFFALALIFLYGMGISGTRGALFALASGIGFALFLSKNFKVLIIGSAFALGGFVVLKYTTIGESSFQIQRLRSALDPNDASFHVRLDNQKKIEFLLRDQPFGAGLGMSGMNGTTYNPDKPIANVQPDSYWVKVWVMYGIVGLLIWFAMVSYIIGKCSGIIWKLKHPQLRTKMIALAAGSVACFISSYGNEVMNAMPSSVILYLSWSFIFVAPELDEQLTSEKHDFLTT